MAQGLYYPDGSFRSDADIKIARARIEATRQTEQLAIPTESKEL